MTIIGSVDGWTTQGFTKATKSTRPLHQSGDLSQSFSAVAQTLLGYCGKPKGSKYTDAEWKSRKEMVSNLVQQTTEKTVNTFNRTAPYDYWKIEAEVDIKDGEPQFEYLITTDGGENIAGHVNPVELRSGTPEPPFMGREAQYDD